MTDTYALAPLPQQTLAGWHRFVSTGDHDLLAPLLAENVIFRSCNPRFPATPPRCWC
jgi:hypothetical protein